MNNKFKILLIIFLSGVLVLLTYLYFFPVTQLSFFWDDVFLIKENQEIEHLENICCAFSDQTILSGGETRFNEHIYRPLRTIYFIIIVNLFGKSETVFHLLNLMLHFFVSFFLFVIISKYKSPKIHYQNVLTIFITLIFLFHPIHLENINTVNACGDMLGSLFFLFGLLYIMKNRNDLSKISIIICGGFCYLAMLCKEIFITSPFIIYILSKYLISENNFSCNNKCSKEKKTAFSYVKIYFYLSIIPLLYLIQRQVIVGNFGQKEMNISLSEHMLYVSQSFMQYIYNFIYPFNLSQLYEAPSNIWLNSLSMVCLTVIIFLSCILKFYNRKYEKISNNFLAFLLSMLPIINIVPINTFINDRLFYFPSIVLMFLIFSLLTETDFLKKGYEIKGKLYFVIKILILVIWFASNYVFGLSRMKDWKNQQILWEKAWKKTGSNFALWNFLTSLYTSGKYAELLEYFQNNKIEVPENEIPYYNMIFCISAGMLNQAELFQFYFNEMIKTNKGPKGETFLTLKEWNNLKKVISAFKFDTAKSILRYMETVEI